jgi:hypothetical protein
MKKTLEIQKFIFLLECTINAPLMNQKLTYNEP